MYYYMSSNTTEPPLSLALIVGNRYMVTWPTRQKWHYNRDNVITEPFFSIIVQGGCNKSDMIMGLSDTIVRAHCTIMIQRNPLLQQPVGCVCVYQR